jgi:septal ring factor EnvC (AmiA/AmiB activator)
MSLKQKQSYIKNQEKDLYQSQKERRKFRSYLKDIDKKLENI